MTGKGGDSACKDWNFLGTGKLVADDVQVNTVSPRGDIFETEDEYIVRRDGKVRRFKKSQVKNVIYDEE